jgi:hypothetical protein
MASVYKTFVADDVLTAAELNTYLMNQTVIVCDSSADYPAAPLEGMLLFDKALDSYVTRTSSAWVLLSPQTTTAKTTWTPALTQSVSVTATINDAVYYRSGVFVDAWANLTVTSGGSAGTALSVTLPVTSSSWTANPVIGQGFIFDTSGTDAFAVTVVASGTTSATFVTTSATAAGSFGVAPNLAIESNDTIRFHLRYTV